MSDPQQAKFEGWAIVDVMGHQRYVGYVTTEAYGQAVLFRIDVPELPERTRVTKQPGYTDSRYLPAGTTVTEGAVAGYTKLVGSGSIYTITPCTKAAALEAVEQNQPRPLMQVQLPVAAQIAAQVDDPYVGSASDRSLSYEDNEALNDAGPDDDEGDDDAVDDGEIDLP